MARRAPAPLALARLFYEGTPYPAIRARTACAGVSRSGWTHGITERLDRAVRAASKKGVYSVGPYSADKVAGLAEQSVDWAQAHPARKQPQAIRQSTLSTTGKKARPGCLRVAFFVRSVRRFSPSDPADGTQFLLATSAFTHISCFAVLTHSPPPLVQTVRAVLRRSLIRSLAVITQNKAALTAATTTTPTMLRVIFRSVFIG